MRAPSPHIEDSICRARPDLLVRMGAGSRAVRSRPWVDVWERDRPRSCPAARSIWSAKPRSCRKLPKVCKLSGIAGMGLPPDPTKGGSFPTIHRGVLAGGRAANAEFLHAASQGVGVKPQLLGGAARAFHHPMS